MVFGEECQKNKVMRHQLFAHRLTRGLDLDDPLTIRLRQGILRDKKFLKRVYEEWYKRLALVMSPCEGPVLELGSGPGFLSEYIPGLITSDVLHCPEVDLVLDGRRLPFRDGSLGGIVMTNVFHHVARPRCLLKEAARCVRPGGAMAMIEPWVSTWSTLIYRTIHHEPFEPQAASWEFPPSGPLSGANGALPWIIFSRDNQRFREEFPEWHISSVTALNPFVYLVSCGFSDLDPMPAWCFGPWCALERAFQPWIGSWAMFSQIVLARTNSKAEPRMTNDPAES